MVKVSLTECKNYDDSKKKIKESISKLGGLDMFIRPNDKVLIKPNWCNPQKNNSPSITNPIFTKNVIELVKEITPNVYIGDLPAIDDEKIVYEILKQSGLDLILKQTNTKLINFNKSGFVAHDIKNYKVLERTDFSKALFYPDVIINLPKLKSHGITYLTGAVKNLFGFVMMEERKYLHSNFSQDDFCEGLIDIYSFLKPRINLNIMDAIISMEGDEGPSYGEKVNLNYIISSIDAVAIDYISALITNHNPLAIQTTKIAKKRGLGVADINKITLVGDTLIKKPFLKHSNYTKKFSDSNSEVIEKSNVDSDTYFPIITEKCVKCGNCFNACPVNAIEKIDGKYVVNESKCIKCYCCIENCKYNAITLNKEINHNKSKSQNNQNNDRIPLKKKENKQEKKEKLKSQNANIRLGIKCNQKCLFCTIANDDDVELTTKQVYEQIDFLAKEQIHDITFTGGEPTIRKDLIDLIKYSKKSKIPVIEIQTNAVNLSDINYLNKLVDAGLNKITMSFHSHIKEKYNKLTSSNHYDLALLGLKNILAKKEKISFSISHVINNINYLDLIDFVNFIEKLRVEYDAPTSMNYYFSFIRPNGNTVNNLSIVPTLTKIKPYLNSLFELLEKNNLIYNIEGLPVCYMEKYYMHNSETIRLLRYKKDKQRQIYLSSDGTYRENFQEYVHDNLKKKSPLCKTCVYDDICVGVWREYADLFSLKELIPIKEKSKENNRNKNNLYF